MSRELAVEIFGIGKKKDFKGGMQEIIGKELSTGALYNLSVWLNDNPWNFNRGDHVTLKLGKESTYGGVVSYSVSLKDIQPLSGAPAQPMDLPPTPPPPPKESPSKEEWLEKEIRGHRRACLAIASALLKDDEKTGAPDVERINMLQLMADKLVDYVMGKEQVPF